MHEDIPPVPPLPKELLPSAAKVNKSPSKSPKRGSGSELAMAAALEQQTESVRNRKAPAPWQTDDYPWPEDIF
jgi:hypothetical protein